MSDINYAVSSCMAVLVPLKFSSEVKTVLVENNLYQNKFRPRRISEKLALPILGNYENIVTEISEKLPVIPLFGTNFIINKSYDNVEWYGRGPHENYQDRKTSSLVGIYNYKVSEMYFPYIRPQENGNRTDTRWLSLTNSEGNGIIIESSNFFEFSSHHQYNDDFDGGNRKSQTHTYDILKRPIVNLNINYKQMGVGGDDSWGKEPHDEYKIKPGNLSFNYSISPIIQ